MSESLQYTQSVSRQALESLIESYLHTPSAELAQSLKSTLSDWSATQNQPLPFHVIESAVEQSPVAVSITDLHANILYTNSCFTEVTGYSAEEIVGQNESVLSYKSTPDEVYEDLWQTIKRKERWSGVLVNKRKDGSRYLAEVLITPVLDAAGKVTHYLGIHHDITDVHALERQVSNQKALIESVVDSAPAAIAVLNDELNVLIDNQAYKKLVSDMRGEPANILLEAMGREDPGFFNLMQRQQSFHDIETPCWIKENSDPRWFSCSGIWFRERPATADAFFSDEKESYLLLVAHEITSQKAQQEAIRRNAMRALLAEEGLMQGMRETLTAAIFQLETPFNMLNAAMDMLQRRNSQSALDESLMSVLGDIREQGMTTIENLRKAVPNGIEIEPVSLNLNQLVHDVLLISTERLLGEGIVVDWQPKPTLKPLLGWEEKLRSMIKQLLDNAIEAIVDSGSPTRAISITTSDDEDGWVRLSICDSGEGIPEALRIRVFEPFFSSKNTARGHHAGMGLTLAQEVVNRHAGTIEIDPNYADGCCVQIRLPVERT